MLVMMKMKIFNFKIIMNSKLMNTILKLIQSNLNNDINLFLIVFCVFYLNLIFFYLK